jgi:hypothetical protein
MKVPAWYEFGESESSWLSLLDGEQQPKWKTIDCNLHACDFTVNTAGMPAIIAAMDQCGVDKAVLLSMAAVKKWSVENKGHRPLRYDDDSGTCYPYSYVDQVCADLWLGLADKDRRRFAPMICGVNPSDLNAVDHVKRMYYKYPRMWRGVGELIGRHDDLKNHSVETEVPRADHAGLLRIYEFCQEVGLPVILHHTADRKQQAGQNSSRERRRP